MNLEKMTAYNYILYIIYRYIYSIYAYKYIFYI